MPIVKPPKIPPTELEGDEVSDEDNVDNG